MENLLLLCQLMRPYCVVSASGEFALDSGAESSARKAHSKARESALNFWCVSPPMCHIWVCIKEQSGLKGQHLCDKKHVISIRATFSPEKIRPHLCVCVFFFFLNPLGVEVLHFNAWFWHLVQKNNWDANGQIFLHLISENSSLCLNFV